MLPPLKSVALTQKKVLLRADFNVPLQNGKILDQSRLERVVPTIEFLVSQGAKVILMAHLGRPSGKRSSETSTSQLVPALTRLLGKTVHHVEDCVGPQVQQAIGQLEDKGILMLENLRYYPEEEANDEAFAKRLSELADIYVNDAFSVSHRAHASVHAITRFLPSCAGFLFEEEVSALEKALHKPGRPLIAVVGGAKVSTKLAILENLVEKVDGLLLGGGIANTFLKARGHEIGGSLFEPEMLDTAKRICEKAKSVDCEIVLPVDVMVAEELKQGVPVQTLELSQLQPQHKIFDIGPKTIVMVRERIEQAETLVWNGPFGVFEMPPFDKGTCAAVQIAAQRTHDDKLFSIAGGGETVAAVTHCGGAKDFSYLSTAGGAFLEWLEGRILPGVEALTQKI